MPSQSPSAGAERLVYERALPAVPLAVGWMRRELDGVLEALGVGRTRRHDVALVLSEAAANVVVHAYDGMRPGLLFALAGLSGRDLRLDVFDVGRGMRPRAASPGLGVGLALMARLSDGLEIAANDSGGSQVSAVFRDVGADMTQAAGAANEVLADYVEALRAGGLQVGEGRALRAEAEHAIARSHELRDNRRRDLLT